MTADGWSLDDQRRPLLKSEKLGTNPSMLLTKDDHEKNNLPDILKRWKKCEDSERKRKKTEQSFTVTHKEIVKADYDLSLNRYQELKIDSIKHAPPLNILQELKALENEIRDELEDLEKILK